MTLSLVLFVSAVVLLVLIAILRRRTAVAGRKLPVPLAIGLLVLISVVVVQASIIAWQDPHEERVKRRTHAMETLPQVIKTLPAGTRFPEIPAAGWLYGDPRPAVGEAARLRVVDIWSMWCPMVVHMAPGMTRLHKRYASKGVEFIGVTDDDEAITSRYAERFKMRWPTAYGVPKNEIDTLGVLRPDLPGEKPYIAPTLYLLDTQGRVLWTDGGGRFHHRNTGKNLQELEQAIDKALAEQGPAATAQSGKWSSS